MPDNTNQVSGPQPYYDEDGITIYHGDWDEIDFGWANVVITDPPYGISYDSGSLRLGGNARSIVGDESSAERDSFLKTWDGPALVFGSWKVAKPAGTKGVLIWDKGGALGMGDLSMPWKFDHEEIYVVGRGFVGRRDCGSVIRVPPEQSMGRLHPHQKPVALMQRLIGKTEGTIIDPFMGSGSTLVAAKSMGRRAIGIELDAGYCEKAAVRLAQGVLALA